MEDNPGESPPLSDLEGSKAIRSPPHDSPLDSPPHPQGESPQELQPISQDEITENTIVRSMSGEDTASVEGAVESVAYDASTVRELEEKNDALEKEVKHLREQMSAMEQSVSSHKISLKKMIDVVNELADQLEESYSYVGEEVSSGLILSSRFGDDISYTTVAKDSTRTGQMEKLGRGVKNWKERHFCLIRDILVYYRKTKDAEPAGVVRLSRCTVEEVDEKVVKKPLAFCISAGRRKLYCSVNERERMLDWMNAIKSAGDIVPSDVRRLLS